MVKPVPPSNPRDNTAVQQRFQRSANRFSASGEKTIFVHSDYESQFNVPQGRPQKEGEILPLPILDLRDSYQPSKPIDKSNSRGTETQHALAQITEGRIYKALIKVKILGYNLNSLKRAQHDKELNDELLEIQALTKELYESIQQMPQSIQDAGSIR